MSKKKVKCIIWGVVLVAVASLLIWKWNVWFGDLPEPDFQLPDHAERLLITPGEDGLHDRNISWVAGKEVAYTLVLHSEQGTKQYQPTVERVTTRGGTTYIYGVQLEGLTPGAYALSVVHPNGLAQAEGRLHIGQHQEGREEFIFIGDIQDPSEDTTGPLLGEIYERYPDIVSWIFVGDIYERPHDRYWNVFYSAVDSIAPETPFIPATGNHEYNGGGTMKLDERWVPTFQMPKNGPAPALGRSYFVDYDHVRIVVLDTNVIFWHLLSTTVWLNKVLDERQDDPFLIVMGHHGVHSVRGGRLNPTMRYLVNPTLTRNGVHLVLQGHDHAYARYNDVDKSPIYVTSTTSPKTYPVGDPKRFVISKSDERFYTHIVVRRDSLFFNTYQRDHTLFDSFAIGK